MPAQWKVEVEGAEFPADLETLRSWGREGRITRESLIYHPTLGRWGYASEFPELAQSIPAIDPLAPGKRTAAKSLLGMALVCLLFSFLVGMLGGSSVLGMLLGMLTFIFFVLGVIMYVLRK